MEAGVFVELGVEGDTELIVLTCGDDAAIDLCQGLGVAVDLDDAGRADKRQRHFTVDAGHLALGAKTDELSAISDALNEYVHGC